VKVGRIEFARNLGDGIDDAALAAVAPGDQHRELPIVGLNDRRQRGAAQTVGRRDADHPRLQSDHFRRPDKVLRRGITADKRKLALDMAGIARDAEDRRDPA
jgi:hypothetical protein